MEILMKTYTKNLTTVLISWKRFLGAVLMAAIMMPVAVMSQDTVVNLGTAGNFVILTKTGITTTGTTQVTGDIGVSPAYAAAITGFGLSEDPSDIFFTSSLVTGKVYAADNTDPTPTNND
jgi:hypothetical protein